MANLLYANVVVIFCARKCIKVTLHDAGNILALICELQLPCNLHVAGKLACSLTSSLYPTQTGPVGVGVRGEEWSGGGGLVGCVCSH